MSCWQFILNVDYMSKSCSSVLACNSFCNDLRFEKQLVDGLGYNAFLVTRDEIFSFICLNLGHVLLFLLIKSSSFSGLNYAGRFTPVFLIA